MHSIQIEVFDSLWSTAVLTQIAMETGVAISAPIETTNPDIFHVIVSSHNLVAFYHFGIAMAERYYSVFLDLRKTAVNADPKI